jgi:hypothetical protein
MKILDNSTVSVDAMYDEPTLDSTGTPLLDLAYTSVYYKVGASPLVVGAKTIATQAQGGGRITVMLIVPAPVDAVTKIDFYVSATDFVGNESAKSAPVPFTIERLAPAVPTNFIIA